MIVNPVSDGCFLQQKELQTVNFWCSGETPVTETISKPIQKSVRGHLFESNRSGPCPNVNFDTKDQNGGVDGDPPPIGGQDFAQASQRTAVKADLKFIYLPFIWLSFSHAHQNDK